MANKITIWVSQKEQVVVKDDQRTFGTVAIRGVGSISIATGQPVAIDRLEIHG